MSYTDEQFEQLEQEERELTEEAIVAMLLLLASVHSDLESAVREFYQKYGKDGVVTYQEARKWTSLKDHRRRLTVLTILFSTKLQSLADDLTPMFTTFLTRVVKKEFDFFDLDLDADILDIPWGIDDAIWQSRLLDDISLWEINLANDLKRAMLRHAHVDDVLAQLDKRFTSMGRIIQRLAMTESTAVGSLARREIFKELGVKKYRYYAREDERTCETCGSLHGLVFPISSYEIGVYCWLTY